MLFKNFHLITQLEHPQIHSTVSESQVRNRGEAIGSGTESMSSNNLSLKNAAIHWLFFQNVFRIDELLK